MSATEQMPPVDERGLNDTQVAQRVQAGESNEVKASPSRSLGAILRSNVFTLFNGIILTAMALVLLAGSWKDAVFGFVIIINTGIGVATELRAKRTLDRLSILVASDYLVRRDGRNVAIGHGGIVLGDLLWLRTGEQVPADGTVLHSWGLELDESMLTGESRTVRKREGDPVYSGASVVSGLALVEVMAVGAHSYAARLTAQARVYKKTVSDLNHGINVILKFMTFLVVPLCILLVWTQMKTVGGWNAAIATGAWRQAVISSVSGVVGMIPEGLVLLTSLNFALAAIRLARKNTLVQDLDSVETLARVDALNLDKTGTITDGGIEFDDLRMLPDAPVSLKAVRQALYDIADEPQPNGTGAAIVHALGAHGYAPSGEGDEGVHARVPFSSSRKWSAVAYVAQRFGTARGEWYMGAPEVMLAALERHDAAGRAATGALLERINAYAAKGSRVLLLAFAAGDGHKASGAWSDAPAINPAACPVALVLCSEHVRPDAAPTLAWFREQGVRCRVISGDNPVTVAAIARKVHLTGMRPVRAMDARELPDDLNEMAKTLEDVDVLGRVLPDQKKAIVEALHLGKHTVAMTGDGVNDALALKEADLGIAMGNAAPATKAVAEVVLVDSKFSHLPDVVARGRQVMANMERVASLFLVKTVYSALISFGVVLMAIPYPYLPRHITYIGALTIGAPSFILALAPNTRRYMPGFLRRVFAFALPCGIATAASVLFAAWFVPHELGWNVERNAAELTQLRSVCAMILFFMGVAVLARVARPLRSWRGLLVAAFAAIGVAGALITFVARFFAIEIPSGPAAWASLAAFAVAAALYALCLWLVPRLIPPAERLVSYVKRGKKG